MFTPGRLALISASLVLCAACSEGLQSNKGSTTMTSTGTDSSVSNAPSSGCVVAHGSGVSVGPFCNAKSCDTGYILNTLTNSCVSTSGLSACVAPVGTGVALYNTCVVTACPANFAVNSELNGCYALTSPCRVEHGSGISSGGGACQNLTCDPGYVVNFPQNTQCVPTANLQSCSVNNGSGFYVPGFSSTTCVVASCNAGYVNSSHILCTSPIDPQCQLPNGRGQIHNGATSLVACNPGFVPSGKACVPAAAIGAGGTACTLPHGSGWYNAPIGQMGPCAVKSCDAGYAPNVVSNVCVATSASPSASAPDHPSRYVTSGTVNAPLPVCPL